MAAQANPVVADFVNAFAEFKNTAQQQVQEVEKRLKEKDLPAEVRKQLEELVSPLQKQFDRLQAQGQLVNHVEREARWFESEALKKAQQTWAKSNLPAPNTLGECRTKSLLLKSVLTSELADSSNVFQLPGLIQFPRRTSRILDLVRRVPIGTNEASSYLRETSRSSRGHVATQVDGAVAADATTVTVDEVEGLLVDEPFRFHLAASIIERHITAINTSTRVVTLDSAPGAIIPDNTRATQDVLGAAAEGAKKSEGLWEVENKSLTLQVIPTLLRTTEQRLANPRILQWLGSDMPLRVHDSVNRHIINGTGTGNTLHGFFADPDVLGLSWSDEDDDTTRADFVLNALSKVVGGVPTGFMNQVEWQRILTAKATDGHYLHGRDSAIAVIDSPALCALGRHPIVLDEAVRDGDFGGAAFDVASELHVREEAAISGGVAAAGVRYGWIDDDFARGRIALLSQEECEHAILRPAACVHGEWDSAPT